jgi:ketosteroid isomerase-like protein
MNHTTTQAPSTPLTPADPKVEAIQRLYDAFFRQDMDAILDELADEIDWAAEASSSTAPWYGSYRTKADVPRFFEALGSTVEFTEFTPLSFASNDTDVMVAIRWGFKVRSTGKTATMNLHHWWRFADGKIVFYRGSDDSELTASVLA